MTEWSVAVDFAADLVDEAVEQVADALAPHGGVLSMGQGRVGARISVETPDVEKAIGRTIDILMEALRQVDLQGPPILRVEAQTAEDVELELAQPNFPELIGVAELAKILGVTRQRVSELARQGSFPQPVAWLQSGPVWTATSVGAFRDAGPRRVGRPPSIVRRLDEWLRPLGFYIRQTPEDRILVHSSWGEFGDLSHTQAEDLLEALDDQLAEKGHVGSDTPFQLLRLEGVTIKRVPTPGPHVVEAPALPRLRRRSTD